MGEDQMTALVAADVSSAPGQIDGGTATTAGLSAGPTRRQLRHGAGPPVVRRPQHGQSMLPTDHAVTAPRGTAPSPETLT